MRIFQSEKQVTVSIRLNAFGELFSAGEPLGVRSPYMGEPPTTWALEYYDIQAVVGGLVRHFYLLICASQCPLSSSLLSGDEEEYD